MAPPSHPRQGEIGHENPGVLCVSAAAGGQCAPSGQPGLLPGALGRAQPQPRQCVACGLGQRQRGDELNIFGYPGIGGDTVTYTRGVVSGFTLDASISGR